LFFITANRLDSQSLPLMPPRNTWCSIRTYSLGLNAGYSMSGEREHITVFVFVLCVSACAAAEPTTKHDVSQRRREDLFPFLSFESAARFEKNAGGALIFVLAKRNCGHATRNLGLPMQPHNANVLFFLTELQSRVLQKRNYPFRKAVAKWPLTLWYFNDSYGKPSLQPVHHLQI
jgi:hypothetical protein